MKRIDLALGSIGNEVSGSENLCDHRQSLRDRIDMLRARAELLAGRDHALMKMYLDNGNTFRQMARLAGVNEATISRRIHKLIQRLLDSEYITCLRNSDKFSSEELCVARDYFLKGLSQKNIAKERNCSLYSIRMALHKIQQLISVESPTRGNTNGNSSNLQTRKTVSVEWDTDGQSGLCNEDVRG